MSLFLYHLDFVQQPRLVNEVLYGLDFCFPNVDNILITSTTVKEYLNNIRTVFFFTFRPIYGIVTNQGKCVFSVQKIQFLGYVVNHNGLKLLPCKVKVGN